MSELTPRLKKLPTSRGTTLTVLDLGTNKIACIIAELEPVSEQDVLRGRTHKCRVIGIGHQRSRGIKGGTVVDLEAAEHAVRHAVDAAERMAKVEVRSAIVNLTGGRLGSMHKSGAVSLRNHPIGPTDIERVVGIAAHGSAQPGRALLHALPIGFSLDGSPVKDPAGMVGSRLGCNLHVVSADHAAGRNLMLAVERCHLEVEAVVATPYASALACLVDDEADMGVVLIDMGAGSTSMAVFSGGRIVHVDAVAVGGHHVTMDVARGLSTRLSDAERLKTLFGSTIATASDERDMITVPQVDEGERDIQAAFPKAHLTRIIRPRIEEILELVRDRLKAAGFASQTGRRVVLTGGASQLTGLPDLARAILSSQVRSGRPLGVKGMPEAAKGPAFSAAIGLLVYPQVASSDRIDLGRGGHFSATGTDGAFSRLTRWLKESF